MPNWLSTLRQSYHPFGEYLPVVNLVTLIPTLARVCACVCVRACV